MKTEETPDQRRERLRALWVNEPEPFTAWMVLAGQVVKHSFTGPGETMPSDLDAQAADFLAWAGAEKGLDESVHPNDLTDRHGVRVASPFPYVLTMVRSWRIATGPAWSFNRSDLTDGGTSTARGLGRASAFDEVVREVDIEAAIEADKSVVRRPPRVELRDGKWRIVEAGRAETESEQVARRRADAERLAPPVDVPAPRDSIDRGIYKARPMRALAPGSAWSCDECHNSKSKARGVLYPFEVVECDEGHRRDGLLFTGGTEPGGYRRRDIHEKEDRIASSIAHRIGADRIFVAFVGGDPAVCGPYRGGRSGAPGTGAERHRLAGEPLCRGRFFARNEADFRGGYTDADFDEDWSERGLSCQDADNLDRRRRCSSCAEDFVPRKSGGRPPASCGKCRGADLTSFEEVLAAFETDSLRRLMVNQPSLMKTWEHRGG